MTNSLSQIDPVLSTPEFVLRPLVPVTLALNVSTNVSEKVSNTSSIDTNTPQGIEEWIKDLTERSEHYAALHPHAKNGRKLHKR